MKVCDRCRKKIDTGSIFTILDTAFCILLKYLLPSDYDLCSDCSREFEKEFKPKFKELQDEIEAWSRKA